MRLLTTNLNFSLLTENLREKSVQVVRFMTETLRGIIVNYRVGPRSQKPKECIIEFSGVRSSAEASRLIGRKIAWKTGRKKVIGKIVFTHGNRGLVRARFRKGVPGQALGSFVEVIG
jgi:large subunit ribosomal protein L35Ae